MVEIYENIEQVQKLKPYLSDKIQKEMAQILAYGEKIKAEGERKKSEFWSKYHRAEFMKLLRYKWEHGNELLGKYEYLDSMRGIEREKFIEEYLHDDMLYSIDVQKCPEKKEGRKYFYEDWKNGNVVIEEGVALDLSCANIGDDGAEFIAKNLKLKEGVYLILAGAKIGPEGAEFIAKNLKLKEGVFLDLLNNKIGAEGAEAIAKNLELEVGVHLRLGRNKIGAEGAEAIAKNLELKNGVTLTLRDNQIGLKGMESIAKNLKLKEGVELDLSWNEIGDEGANAIIKNMKLKEGVYLHLENNEISKDMKQKLKEWEKSYHDRGIKCKVLVD